MASLGSCIESIRALHACGQDEEAVRVAQLALRDHHAEAAKVADIHYLMALSLFTLRRENEAAKYYALALEAMEWQ